MVISDGELMRLIARGDDAACEELYRRYGKKLFGYLYHLTSDRERAEDVLQQVMERLVRTAPVWRPGGSLQSWLYTVGANIVRKEYHAAQRNQAVLEDQFERRVQEEEMSEPEKIVELEQRKERVRGAIGRLSQELKEVVVLRHYQGLSLKDIAEIQQAPSSTVRWRWFRAMEILRGSLSDLG